MVQKYFSTLAIFKKMLKSDQAASSSPESVVYYVLYYCMTVYVVVNV